MRHLLTIIFLLWSGFLFGQEGNSIIDNQIKFKEGVYTSLYEITENSPKYYDCLFETQVDFWFGKMSIYYTDKYGAKHELKDTILLVVENGKRYVKYKNRFCKLILTGAISTFFIETTYISSSGYEDKQAKLYFWDVKTGMKDKLNHTKIDEIIKRDSLIYSAYSNISDSKKEKTLYSYILKYNLRNPIYIK